MVFRLFLHASRKERAQTAAGLAVARRVVGLGESVELDKRLPLSWS